MLQYIAEMREWEEEIRRMRWRLEEEEDKSCHIGIN